MKTKERERELTVTGRNMLRYVFRIFRHKQEGQPEPWENYMRRSAKQVDEIASTFNMEDWVAQFRRRKWTFAGKAVRQTDDRWSKLVLSWCPNHGAGREKGRPKTIWSDDIIGVVGGDWMDAAFDEDSWECLKFGYVYGVA